MTGVLRLSPEQAEVLEALQAGRDPEVFARDVLGVDLNPAQRRWFRLVRTQEDGWQWRLKAVLHVAANQIGKTLGLGILILWAAWYKIGISTDDPAAWQRAPYQWFHLAPTQQQAYLTLKDIVLLLDGTHFAQKRPSKLPRGLVQQVKIEQYYDGLSLWNGALVQFRTTEDKAKALQGRRANGISYDEAAFEDHLKSVINETLLMRLISTGGPLWLVSTPNGINDWYEVVIAVQENALARYVPDESDLFGGSAVPGEPLPMWETSEGWALVWSTVADNVGFGIPEEQAARMERDLDPATKEQQLRGAFLEPQDAFFVPSDIIDKAFRDMPEEVAPQYGHRYVIAWDVSDKVDPTVVIVIDITTKPWRGVYFRYYERPLGETKLLVEMYKLHAYYNGGALRRTRYQKHPRAITGFDSTSMGGSMITSSLVGLSPKRPVNLAGPNTKRIALGNLRAALSKGELILPRSWARVRREVLTYKLPDDKIRQDCVMTLLENVEIASKGWSGDAQQRFAPHGRNGAPRTR